MSMKELLYKGLNSTLKLFYKNESNTGQLHSNLCWWLLPCL